MRSAWSRRLKRWVRRFGLLQLHGCEVRHAMASTLPHCDMGQNDGIALLAISELAQVEVVLESGTANGRSTELMARFLKAEITTVVPWRARLDVQAA